MAASDARRRFHPDEEPRHWGRAPGGAPAAQRYVNGRLAKAAGFVDDEGMYYPMPKSRVWPVIQAVLIGIILAAGFTFLVPLLLAPAKPMMTTQQPLGTANVLPRPTQEPASAPIFDQATPIPTYDNQAWNSTAEAVQQVEVQAAPPEVLIVITPTVLPEPGAEGFAASFLEPVCSPLLDYLPGHPCYGHVGQTRPTPWPTSDLPQPGDPGFAESFEEPGD